VCCQTPRSSKLWAVNDDELNALIHGGIRSLAQLVPGVGGMWAQAWSEYETFHQNKRVSEFFAQFTKRMATMEMQHIDLKDRVATLEDRSELLEDIVSRVKREPEASKREYFVNVLCYFALEPGATTRDERQSIIDDVDSLTVQDVDYLGKFSSGALRGDIITSTTFPGFSIDQVIGKTVEEKWDRILGPAIHSLAKLEGRGLIVPATVNAMIGFEGPADTWNNQFRRKAWRITSTGSKVLRAISEKEH
jgi:hypothetical protein